MFNNELFLLRFGKYMKQLLSIKEKALKIVKSVRGSTAAEINISLLPRDCSCGEVADGAVWGRDLFGVFVGFPVVLSGEETFSLAFGVFGIRLIRYRKRPPMVRNMRAVRRTAFCGTRRIGSPPCSKQASTVRNRHSVRKTPSCGTRRIFRGTRCKKQAFLVQE